MKTKLLSCGLLFVVFSSWANTNPPASTANRPTSNPPTSELRVYIAQDESARKVLGSLLSLFGLKLVGDAIPTRPVSGRFETRSVEDAMNYFRSAYQINWFQNGTNVYVYRSADWQTKRVYVGGERTNDEWKEYLNAAGLLYKEFPFVFNADQKNLVISGPKSYIRLVENAFEISPPDPSEIEKHGISLMTFPLKHASVEDRQTNLRGTAVVTPGALSVLLNLLDLPQQTVSTTPEAKVGGKLINRGRSGAPAFGNEAERMGQLPGSPTSGIPKTSPPKVDPMAVTPTVTADPRTNTLLIRDAKSKYNYYKDLIDQLDKPVSMVEVEAMMVEVDQKGLEELGVEFGFINRYLSYEFPGSASNRGSVLGVAGETGRFPPGITPGATSIVDPTRFMARIRALESDENAKVLARPTILTQDNVPAFIDLSQTVFLPVFGERVAQLEQVTAGSLLQVTPRVVSSDGEDRIFMRIEIQDGTLVQDDLIGFERGARIQNTSLSTQALIQTDKAILIGGYSRESKEAREFKVPVLGDLPFVGRAFKTSEQTNRSLSRLFLIVPKLVDRPLQDTESSRKSVDLIKRNFQVQGTTFEPTPSLRIDTDLNRR